MLRYKEFLINCKHYEKINNFTERFVEFSSADLTVPKSADLLVVRLVSSDVLLSESFIVGVIAEADNPESSITGT